MGVILMDNPPLSAMDEPQETRELRAQLASAREELRKCREECAHFQAVASLLDHVRNAVIATDVSGRVTYWNRFAETLFQWTAEEALGRCVLELTVPEADKEAGREILEHLGKTENWQGEFQVRRKDGSVFLAHATDAALRNHKGEVIGFVGVSEDITQRAREQAELRSQKEILQTIFDQVPVMIVFSDEQGRIKMANRQFERILGYSLEEVRGRNMIAEMCPEPELWQVVFEFLRNPTRKWQEFPARSKSGEILQTSWGSAMLEDGTSVAIGLDVSIQKRTEKEREELLRKITASQEMLETLSRRLLDAQETERRNLARELHDEVGPILTMVHLNIESLRKRVDPALWPRLNESVDVVNRAIEQIRNLSFDLRPASLDLLGLEAALRTYLKRQSARAGIDLDFQSTLGEKRLPAVVETVCFRVVQEAMNNVIRHSRASRCQVNLSLDDSQVRVRVHDDGIGFDVASAKERGLQGEGFGLLGMFERVQLFGGQISIESVKGQGTTLEATFPIDGASKLPKEGPSQSKGRADNKR